MLSQRTILRAVLFAACFSCLGAPVWGQPAPSGKVGTASNAPGPQGGSDKDKLQGKWQILSIAIEDKVIKRSDAPGEWKETFLNDVVIQGDRLGQTKASLGTFKLDDTRNPKQITVQDAEGKLTFRGIYSLEGDNMRVCIGGDGTDVRRPEEFVTKKGAPLIFMELKRATEKK